MIRMLAFACLTLAACTPQTAEAPPVKYPGAQEATSALPPLPPPGPLEESALRTLRIDLLDGQPPAITGKVPSFFVVEGYAPADWIFEAVFPVRVEIDGEVVAQVPATSLDDWTNGALHHPYRAVVSIDVAEEVDAVLVLEEDMPKHDANGDELPPRNVRLPVTLAPAQ